MQTDWTVLTFPQLGVDNLYDLLQLRDQVFVVEQASIYGDLDGLDRPALHLLGRDGRGARVAYARRLPPGSKRDGEVAIGRVVIAPAGRGQGLGKQLMQLALDTAARHFPGTPLWLSAQVDKIGLYRQFGFVDQGDAYDDGGILHRDMCRPV